MSNRTYVYIIHRFDNSRLAANNPIEDRHSEGYCNGTDGFLFGIFDGHAGVANAQAVSERLFNYIAVNLLSPDQLTSFCDRMNKSQEEPNLIKFLTHNTTYFNKVRGEILDSYVYFYLLFLKNWLCKVLYYYDINNVFKELVM